MEERKETEQGSQKVEEKVAEAQNNIYKYFSEEELTCNCGCGRQEMDDDFMQVMDSIRENLGYPLIVTSAYRCPEYNNRVSTTGYNGPHTTGKALDIAISGEKAFWLILEAYENGFTGIESKRRT